MKIKIYTNNRMILEKVADHYGVSLEYLKRGVGTGYCCLDGKTFRVFVKGSHVDLAKHIIDVTPAFKNKFGDF